MRGIRPRQHGSAATAAKSKLPCAGISRKMASHRVSGRGCRGRRRALGFAGRGGRRPVACGRSGRPRPGSARSPGRTRSILEVAATARASGARIVGITGSNSPLAVRCDVVLIVQTLDNTDIYTPTISRLAALVVVDILSTSVALRRDGDHPRRFRLMKDRLAELRLDPGSDD